MVEPVGFAPTFPLERNSVEGPMRLSPWLNINNNKITNKIPL